ncbi:MAG TPA: Imm53 family immunity protein [Candidatus Didemnitutus sp.]|nr:Imm53 family immunity protein [Candidatus Didemnitutus sp.]
MNTVVGFLSSVIEDIRLMGEVHATDGKADSDRVLNISTIDNPGWDVVVLMNNVTAAWSKPGLLFAWDPGDDSWLRVWCKSSPDRRNATAVHSLVVSGGGRNLCLVLWVTSQMLSKGVVSDGDVLNAYGRMPGSSVLEQWYTSNCDGEWEHTFGVRMSIDTNWLLRAEICFTDEYEENNRVADLVNHNRITRWTPAREVGRAPYLTMAGSVDEVIDSIELLLCEYIPRKFKPSL